MYIDWSWWAFAAGVVASLILQFVVLVAVAVSQYKKQKKKAAGAVDAFTNLVNGWSDK